MKRHKLWVVTFVLLLLIGMAWWAVQRHGIATRQQQAGEADPTSVVADVKQPRQTGVETKASPTSMGSSAPTSGFSSPASPDPPQDMSQFADATKPVPLPPAAIPSSPALASNVPTPEHERQPKEPRQDDLSLAQILSQPVDMSNPANRAELVRKLRELEKQKRQFVLAKAKALGVPLTMEKAGGRAATLVDFDGDRPIYEESHNVNAAISTAANLVRSTAPYNVDGSGITIGLWEANESDTGNIPRLSHQEFGSPSRISVGDGSSIYSSHATHVAGTLIAAGVNAGLKGMASNASILAYSSASDSSEATAIGAAYAGEPGKLLLSNHSYGIAAGWDLAVLNSNYVWVWTGTFTDDGNSANDVDTWFGRYQSTTATWDGLLYQLPYFQPFVSSGNDANDGPPASGETWYEGSTSGTSRTYNASQHPLGDGAYKSGYDLITTRAVAKNVITVGAVTDAVSAGSRNLSLAILTNFSSTGPTDDGRIKPDIVGNGYQLTSADETNDSASVIESGTSMSSPNACGSAALLVAYYANRFPGGAMRASTLKSLIIHTADDLGNPGPDYRYGWGLMNTKAAADLIKRHADNAGNRGLTEGRLTTAKQSDTYSFTWDGTSPIRATLCWTDPAGVSTTVHDDRTKKLVNDLNLKITNPSSTTLRPYVMPYVGDWTAAKLSANATTGINTVDNVEQVYVSSPATPGVYVVTVDYTGTLTNGVQDYSLIISGQADDALAITETSDYTSSGFVGGPFSPTSATYTVKNTSATSMNWTATADQNWLDLTPSSGTLAAGDSITVTASPNANANALAAGTQSSVMSFTNTGTGVSLQRRAWLTVRPVINGGPDAFGYTVTNNTPYSFTDISSTGTAILANDDDSTLSVPIGFAFPFYGAEFSSTYVSSNGLLAFGSANSGYLNSDLTAASAGRPVICPLWDDWYTNKTTADKVYYSTTGSPGSRVFTVQWVVNPSTVTPSSEVAFQCQLSEGSGVVRFNYRDADTGSAGTAYAASSTVGIQNTSGNTTGQKLQWSFNTASLWDGLSIVFTPPVLAPEVVIEHPAGTNLTNGSGIDFGVINPGSSSTAKPFTIKNTGTSPLTGISISVTGGNPGDFSLNTTGMATSLNAGASTTFAVTFSPSAQGARSTELRVASNDADENPFNITLTGSGNQPPTITNVLDQLIAEDSSTGSLAFTIGDVETAASSLTMSVTSSNTALIPVGSISFSGNTDNRTVAITPVANGNGGPVTVTLRVTDAHGAYAEDTVLVTVSAMNDPPSFTKGVDQSVNANAGAQTVGNWASSISAGPPDESGQLLNFIVSNNNTALFSAQPAISATGMLTYAPAATANGTAIVTVSLHDNGGGSDTSAAQTFNITITPNQSPTISDVIDQTVLEDGNSAALAFSIGDAETTTASLALSVISSNTTLLPPTGLTFGGAGANRTLTVTPAANLNGGPVTITIRVTDGLGAFVEDSFNVTVTAVNDVPSFTKGANQNINANAGAQTLANWATAISAGPSDEGTQLLTFAVSNNNTALFNTQPAISPTGTLTFAPAATANGTATVSVSLSDDGGVANGGVNTSAVQTFTITVAPNQAPTISDVINQTVLEDGTTAALAFTIGDAETSTGSLTISVTSSDTLLVPSGGLNLGGSGPNRTVTIAPAANKNGISTITLRVTDALGAYAEDTFTLTVTPVNDAPSFVKGADQSINANAGAQTIVNWASSISAGPPDENLQTLAFQVTNSNNALFVTQPAINQAGTLFFAPAATASGSATVSVALQDSGGVLFGGVDTSATQTFTITVAPNQAPTISDVINQTVLEDGSTGALAFSIGDLETPATSLNVTVGSSNSILVPVENITLGGIGANRTVTVIPAANQNGGPVTVTLRVTDALGAYVEDTFALTITGVNDAPSFTKGADQFAYPNSGLQTVSAWATNISAGPADESGQTFAFIVSNNNNALFSVQPAVAANGTLTFTPTAAATGTATITVSLQDNGGTSNGGANTSEAQTFLISVTPNQTPTISSIIDQTILEDAATGALAFTIGDVETPAGSLTLTAASSDTSLVPVNNIVFGGSGANRTVVVTPVPNGNGPVTVTLRVQDALDAYAEASFVLTVTAVNDVPSFIKGANQSLNANGGAQSITNWASSISAGPANESGQTLTFLVTNNNNALFSTQPAISASGTLSFTPAATANGSATVTVSLQDSGGTSNGGVNTSAAQTFTITIAPNQPPTISDIVNQTVLEDGSTGALAFTIGDAETSAGSLVVAVTSSDTTLVPPGGISLGGTGTSRTVTVTPAANLNGGPVTLTVRVTDGLNAFVEDSFTVTVIAVNDAPSFTKGSNQSINANAGAQTVAAWATNISAGPPNENAQTVSFVVTNDNNSLFSSQPAVSSSGMLTFAPAATANGLATVSVTLQDSGGVANGGVNASAVQTLTITVTPNQAPTISDVANQSLLEDGNTGTLAIDINDAETATTSLALSAISSNPTLVPLSGITFGGTGPNRTVTITPAANTNGGPVTVTLRVTDGLGAFAEDTLTVSITAVNDAPSFTKGGNQLVNANAGPQTITNWASTISAGPSDESSQSLTFLVSNNNNVLFTTQPTISSAGTLAFTPDPSGNGTATVIVQLQDSGGTLNGGIDLSPAQTFTITVTPNQQPTIGDIVNQTILEDGSTGALAFTIGDAETPTANLNISATSSNTALVPLSGIVFGGSGANRTVTITPAANANGGPSVITVRVTDGLGLYAEDILNVTVTAVNDAPTFTKGPNQSLNANAGAQNITAWATNISAGPADESAQILTFQVTNNNNALFSTQPAISASGTLSFTPAATANGSATVTVSLQDSGGTSNGGVNTSATQTFTITIAPNQTPTISDITNQTILEDTSTGALAFTIGDAETAAASLSVSAASSDLTLVPSENLGLSGSGTNRTITVTPGTNANGGPATITVRVTDGLGTYVEDTFTVNVTPVNDAPSFTKGPNQTLNANAGAQSISGWATNISAGPANESAQTLSFSVSNDNNALFAVQPTVSSSGTLTFTPAPTANGSSVVSVSVQDSGGTTNGGVNTSAAQTFTITVTPNLVPTISDITNQTILEDNSTGALAFTVGDAETAPGSLSVTASSSDNIVVPNGNIVISGSGASRTVTVTPAANQNGGPVTITVQVTDALGVTAQDTFALTITPVNDAPSFVKGGNQSVSATTGAQTVAGWATAISAGPANESSQTLSFQVTNDNNGLFTVQPLVAADGTLTYTPNSAVAGTATVTATLADNGGTANGGVDSSAAQTFTITTSLGPVNLNLASVMPHTLSFVTTVPSDGDGSNSVDGNLTTSDGQSTWQTTNINTDYMSLEVAYAQPVIVSELKAFCEGYNLSGSILGFFTHVHFDVFNTITGNWDEVGTGDPPHIGAPGYIGVTFAPKTTVKTRIRFRASRSDGATLTLAQGRIYEFEAYGTLPTPAPEIVVEQPVGNNLTTGSASASFGGVAAGSSSNPLTFTIKNTGTASLTGLAITKDGTGAGDFSVGALGATTLTPNTSTTFNVTFSPSAGGSRSAAIHIASNDADENPFDIALTGTGTAPEIAVEQPIGTSLADGVASTGFGMLLMGSTSGASTYTIRNLGTAELSGLSITKDGPEAGDFTVSSLGASTLAPNETTTFSVVFSPKGIGSRTAALHIASNDTDENPFDIGLVGVGTSRLGYEAESNDTAATANPLSGTAGGMKITGDIYPIGDVDYYSFTAQAGDRVYAAVMTSFTANSLDSQLRIMAPDGTTELEFDEDDGSFGSTASSIAGLVLPASGKYFVRVNRKDDGGTIRPYHLWLRVTSGAPTAESEDNGSFPGQTMPSSFWVSGSTSSASDKDYYNFNLNAGDTVFMSLDLDPERDGITWDGWTGLGPLGDPIAILVSSDGNTVSPNSEAAFMTVKDAGNYTVTVETQSGATTFGTYHLSVTVLPASGRPSTTYASTDVPKSIPDGSGLVTSTITVPDSMRIGKLKVALNISHNLMQDLDISLTAPDGNNVGLITDRGSSVAGSQTTMNLILDDDAGIPPLFQMMSGMICQPEQNYRLDWFKGQQAMGTWTLTIRDDTATNTGTLNNWSLVFEDEDPLPTGVPTTIYASDFETSDGGFTHTGTLDEWQRGLPAFAPITSANSGTNCWKTDLADTYEASSNQDLLSPVIDLAAVPSGVSIVASWAMKYQMQSANFDHAFVEVQEVGGAGMTRKLWEWMGATMTNPEGNPAVTTNMGGGWGLHRALVSDFAGKQVRLRFHLDSDPTTQLAGLAIDDVSVTAFGLPTPEIAVEQPAGTGLTDNVGTADCGAVSPGNTSLRSFTIKNTGNASLTGLMVTKDGAHAGEFTLGALGATTLAPNTSTTFTVTFSPSSTGSRTAAIHIASNDVDENPFDISLVGTGLPLSLVVAPSSLAVNEGATAQLTVRLSGQPPGNLGVNVTRATGGDADLDVSSGASLTFNIGNWQTNQVVTLAAAEDADSINGTASFEVVAPGMATVTVFATESDNDGPPLALTRNYTLVVPPGGSGTITSAHLQAVSASAPASQVVYTLASPLPYVGHVKKNADPVGWLFNPATGHYYRATRPGARTSTAAEAGSVGGYLTSISNAAENNWITSNFSRSGQAWNGLNDPGGWDNGEGVSFTNWYGGEPNSGDENYVNMYFSADRVNGNGATWNDLSNSDRSIVGIAEKNTSSGIQLSFTQEDIDLGRISYEHFGTYYGPSIETPDDFTFTVSDGQGNTIGSTVFSIVTGPAGSLAGPSTPVSNDQAGYSVAVSGEWAVAGVPYDFIGDAGTPDGRALVYRRVDGQWMLHQVLTPTGGADKFGIAVDIDGDTIVVGSDKDSTSTLFQGSAFVFVRGSDNVWSQQQKLTASDGGNIDLFGSAVAVNGNTIVVAAPDDDGLSYVGNGASGIDSVHDQGVVYVFTRSNGTWSEEAKFNDPEVDGFDYFGQSVDIEGSTIVVGAADGTPSGSSAVEAYVFVKTGATWQQRTRQAKLVASPGGAGNSGAISVSLNSERLAVGNYSAAVGGNTAQGNVSLFRREGTSWISESTIAGSNGVANDNFGRSVALSGDILLVGAAQHVTTAPNTGKAYVFHHTGNSWSEAEVLTAADAQPNDNFGKAVALDGTHAFIGSPFDDIGGLTDRGSVFSFDLTPYSSPIIPTIVSLSATSGRPGDSITITGTNFSTTLANNIVWFGGVRGTVTAATATQLTVTVPAGAAYGPLAVQVGGRVATGTQLFVPTFAGDGSMLALNFGSSANRTVPAGRPTFVMAADFDGDGRSDVAVVNYDSSYSPAIIDHNVSVYRNLSTPGTLDTSSFTASPVMLTPETGCHGGATGDLNGDGKIDIVTFNLQGTVSVFQNTSTSVGTISFAAPVTFSVGNNTVRGLLADYDGDGRLDIVAGHYNAQGVSIFRNRNAGGNLNAADFTPDFDLVTSGGDARNPAVGDWDGDGRLDLAINQIGPTPDLITFFRNTGAGAPLQASNFAAPQNLNVGDFLMVLRTADFDLDGKHDLAASSYYATAGGSTLWIMRNGNSSGAILPGSFLAREFPATPSNGYGMDVADLNGDGKTDVITCNYNEIALVRNTSTVGVLDGASFAAPILVTGSGDYVLVMDLDNDGRPDLLTSRDSVGWSYHRNTTPFSAPEIAIEQPGGTELTDGVATVPLGSSAVGTPVVRTFTVRNVGAANLTGLAVTKDGANSADFVVGALGATTLVPGASTTFDVTFTPSVADSRTAAIHIASNDADENPFDISLSGLGLTAQENWRQIWFGNTGNSGTAADTFDFDHDGLPNVVEFAFGLNPTISSSMQLPQGQVTGGNFVISFATPPGVSDIIYGAEWSTTLSSNPADWTAIPDSGAGNNHTFAVPIGTNQRVFMRLKVTVP